MPRDANQRICYKIYMSRHPEKQLLHAGFKFARFFCPNHEVAERVTFEAWNYTSQLEKNQEHRNWRKRSSTKPHMLILPRTDLFQKALCIKLNEWEQIQKVWSPAERNGMVGPSNEDMLRRYVRFLLWKTMDCHPSYLAIALGCLLYSYSPGEVVEFTQGVWDKDFGHVKMRLLGQIQKRFKVKMHSDPLHGETKIDGRAPSPKEARLIKNTLGIFTSWREEDKPPSHPVQKGSSLLPLFDPSANSPNSDDLAGKQIHALACPKCGSITQLVKEWNQEKPVTNRLADPDQKLIVPSFVDTDPAGGNPSSPAPRADMWERLQDFLSDQKHRRKKYHGRLRILVDSQKKRLFDPFDPHQPLSDHFNIDDDVTRIEVFGDDERGELLFAAFSIPDLEALEGQQPREFYITQEGGQRISIRVAASREKSGTIKGQVTFRYAETRPIRAAMLFWRRRPRVLLVREAVIAILMIALGVQYYIGVKRQAQDMLRMEGKTAIDGGFAETMQLQALLDNTSRREITEAVRRINVVTLPAVPYGATYPYPTFGKQLGNPITIGDALHQFPDLQASYDEYLRHWVRIFQQLGDILKDAGKLDEAIQVFEYLRKVSPQDKSLLFSLGELYKMQDNHVSAIALYEDMMAQEEIPQGPDYRPDPRPWHYAGWSYFLLGDFQKALEYYNTAISISPKYAKAFYNRALIYKELGLDNPENARLYQDTLQKALDLALEAYQPEGDNNPGLTFTLAIIYTEKREAKTALYYLERTLQKDRAYIIRSEKERAFEFFRDSANEPFHSEFTSLLNLYRPQEENKLSAQDEAKFGPYRPWE